jgi:hypothetical protein
LHSLESSKLSKSRNRGAKIMVSNPLNPVQLHIQFNSDTGELIGLPLYCCPLLSESGCVPRPRVDLLSPTWSDSNAKVSGSLCFQSMPPKYPYRLEQTPVSTQVCCLRRQHILQITQCTREAGYTSRGAPQSRWRRTPTKA